MRMDCGRWYDAISFLFHEYTSLFNWSFLAGIISFQDVHIRVQGPVSVPEEHNKNHTSWWPLRSSSWASQRRRQGDRFLWIGSPYLTSSNTGPRPPRLSNQAIPYKNSGAWLLRVPQNNTVTSRWLDGNIHDQCLVPLSRIRQDFSWIWGGSCELEPSRPQWMRRTLQIFWPWGFRCFSLQRLLWQQRVPLPLLSISFVPFRPVWALPFSCPCKKWSFNVRKINSRLNSWQCRVPASIASSLSYYLGNLTSPGWSSMLCLGLTLYVSLSNVRACVKQRDHVQTLPFGSRKSHNGTKRNVSLLASRLNHT